MELPRLKTPLQVSFKNTKLLGANYFSRKEKTFTAGRFFFHSISTGDSTGDSTEDSPGDSTEDSPEDSTEDFPKDSTGRDFEPTKLLPKSFESSR